MLQRLVGSSKSKLSKKRTRHKRKTEGQQRKVSKHSKSSFLSKSFLNLRNLMKDDKSQDKNSDSSFDLRMSQLEVAPTEVQVEDPMLKPHDEETDEEEDIRDQFLESVRKGSSDFDLFKEFKAKKVVFLESGELEDESPSPDAKDGKNNKKESFKEREERENEENSPPLPKRPSTTGKEPLEC